MLHDLFLKGPVFSFLTQAPRCSKKPPRVGSETAKKKKFVFPLTRSFFAAKVTPAAHPRALLSCPLLSLEIECAAAHGGFPPRQ
jgi:hypothetical protein